MRLRNTLIAFVVLVIVGGYVYLVESKKQRVGDEKEKLFYNIKKEDAQELDLNFWNGEIKLKKDGAGKWRIGSPLDAPADSDAVDSMVSAILTTDINRVIEQNPKEIQTFGLDEPFVKATVKLKEGKSLPSIWLGKKTPIGTAIYLKKETDKRVLLTDLSLQTSLDKTVNDLRDKQIIDFKDEDVRKIELNGTEGYRLLVKRDKDWYLEAPKKYKADEGEVNSIFSSLKSLRVKEFENDAPKELKQYGLDPPRRTVILFLGDRGDRKMLLMGDNKRTKEEVYVTRESKDRVYSVVSSNLRDFIKDISALRDRRILNFERDKAARVQMKVSDETYTLSRVKDKQKKDEWQIELGLGKTEKGDADEISTMLITLQYLKGKEIVEDEAKDLKPYGLDKPQIQTTVVGADGKTIAAITIGNKREEKGKEVGYFTKKSDSPMIYLLEEIDFNQLNKKSADFKKKPEPAV